MILSKTSVIIISLANFFSGVLGMALYTYIPRYLFYMGIEKSIIQLVSTILAFTNFAFPPLVGSFSDKIQNRYHIFIFGAIADTLLFSWLLFHRTLIMIIIAIFAHGFFLACFGLILILFQELVENDQKMISYLNAIGALGWFAGAQLCGIFVEINGIEDIFHFFLIFAIISMILVFFARENRFIILNRARENKKLSENSKNHYIADRNENSSNEISKSVYYSLFFRHFGIRPILSILAIIMALYLNDDIQIGFLMGINPLLQFFFIIIFGKLINEKNEKIVIVMGYVLSTFVVIGYLLSTNFFGFLISQILIALSYSMFYSAIYFYISKHTTPKNKGKYIGYVNSSFFLGGFSGGLFFSLLLTINPDYYFGIPFMILFPIISTLIILFKFKR
ncbi:MAG: MFS transporter [Promethearchaeota archaeon]